MRILEIEQLFQSEDTLDQVFERLSDSFCRIDDYADMAKANVFTTAEQVDKVLTELSGCHSDVITVLGVAKTEKKNRQGEKYSEIKINHENAAAVDDKGKLIKFVDSVAKQEASTFVAKYRRIKNIVEAYKDSCETSISVLQSVLKDLGRDYNNPQG